MNEQLQNALLEILTSVTSSAGQAKDFLIAELPDIAKQLLAWKMTESFIFCSAGVVLLFTSLFLYYRATFVAFKKDDAGDCQLLDVEDRSGRIILSSMALIIFGGLGASCIAYNLQWLQILIAPKIYLIEYASELVK